MSGKPLRHNMAKVEILGCLEKVESMLSQGFSKRIIYERLLEEKRLSMAYVTFCKLTARIAKPSPLPFSQENTTPAPVQVPQPPPVQAPQPPPVQQSPRSGPGSSIPPKNRFPILVK